MRKEKMKELGSEGRGCGVSIVKWQNLPGGGSFLYRRCSIEKVRAQQRMGWGGRTRRTGAGWSSILCFLLAILSFFSFFFFYSFLSSPFPGSYEYVEHGTARSEGNPSVFYYLPGEDHQPAPPQIIVVR